MCGPTGHLVHSGGDLGQVLVDAGHRELDLVADALLGAFGRVCRRDAEEQQSVQTEQGVHLRRTEMIFIDFFTKLNVIHGKKNGSPHR